MGQASLQQWINRNEGLWIMTLCSVVVGHCNIEDNNFILYHHENLKSCIRKHIVSDIWELFIS
jgi:nitrate/TMAO reductase-like tetraheme cytochrome c subunit